jgi:hypothetical protein
MEYDPARAQMALSMVSVLFNNHVPMIGTDISDITSQAKVQIAWQARLNGPLANMAGQAGYGWHQVKAAEIGACAFIENLLASVYGKLVPAPVVSSPDQEMHLTHVTEFLSDIHSSNTNVKDGDA